MRLLDLFEQFGSTTISHDMEATLPPVAIMPELDNSNGYKQYRFMSDMASARAVAAGEVEFKKIVPWTQYLTVVGYTPEELETVRLACEQSGIDFEMLNHSLSKEPDWVNTRSTVMPFHMSEHKRSNAKLTGLFESNDKQVLVIYPGRFQPLHAGHQAVFQSLQEEFGDNVYIATSDKTDGERSPFDYNDKTVMARAANIPLDKVVQVKSPYSPSEITKMFDPNTTVLIFVVGGKDMDLDPRFKFDDKKDGTKSYLQKFDDNKVAEPMSKHGYVMSAPTVEFELLGAPITSATQVRKLYADSDDAKRDKILKDLYGKNSSEIRTMFDRKLGNSSLQLSESAHSESFIDNMRKFFAIAQRDLELDSLPNIVWTSASTANGERPTFGKFQNDNNTITVSIVNRHPIDIMRTLAHELTHYKQHMTKGLDAASGETGSPEEDEANAVAGQIMRHFDEENPGAFDIKPVIAESVTSMTPAEVEAVVNKHVNNMTTAEMEAAVKHADDSSDNSTDKSADPKVFLKRLMIKLILKKLGKSVAGPPGGIAGGIIGSAIAKALIKDKTVNEEVWDHPNPVKKHKKLSPSDKSAAKRRAAAAGRKYPNMVDNIWAARR